MQSICARVIEGSLPVEWMNTLFAYVSPECYMGYWDYKESFPVNMAILILVWGIAIGIHRIRLEKKAAGVYKERRPQPGRSRI